MNDLIVAFNTANIRYLLIGGQAMRLAGMPRYSMDWDFFIPPRDEANFDVLNHLLEDELDSPLVALGSRGENFVQTYQTKWGVLQFHLVIPGVPRFDEAEKNLIARKNDHGTPVRCLSGKDLLAAKR